MRAIARPENNASRIDQVSMSIIRTVPRAEKFEEVQS